MISLAYYSTASAPTTTADLSAIVAQAQRNNSANAITGMLCHHDGSFLQFLEGPEDAVEQTFKRIKGDARHCAVVEVDRRQIKQRAFGEWSMSVVKPDEISPEQRAFCQSLREVEISATVSHRATLNGLLQAFLLWLR